MAIGILNPNDAAHATPTRPTPVRPGINARQWFSDPLNTEVRDHDLNDILAQIRYAIDFYTITDVEGDDTLLQQAIAAGAGALSGNIAALQSVIGAADKVPYWTSSSVMSSFTATSYSRGLLAKTSLVQWQDALGLSAVTSPNVIALSGLPGGVDKLPYFDGFGSMAQTNITAAARSLLDDAAVSDMRTTLGLGTMALAAASSYMPIAGGIFTGNIAGGGAGTAWVQSINTVDGADSGALVLAGGGSNNSTRGAFLSLFGNEHATLPGQVLLSGTTIGITGTITSNLKVGGPGSVFSITQSTVDGTDTGSLVLGGGGAAPDGTRGAYMVLYGNEVTTVGGSVLISGPTGVNVSSGAGTFAVTGPMTVSGALVLASSFVRALNPQNVDYSFVLLDAGKIVRHNSSTPHAYTIQPESSVPHAVGSIIGVMARGSGTVTLTRGAGVTLLGASGVDADYTVTSGQYVEVVKTDNNTWKLQLGLASGRILGNASGAPSVATGLTAAEAKGILAIDTTDVSGLAASLATKANLSGAAFSGSVTFAAAPTVGGNALFHAGNDGAGSGLDADLLDGSNGTVYLARANHTGTQAPATILMAATARLLGRSTAGSGIAEELTAAQAKTLLAIASGDVSGLTYFATGTDAANLTGTIANARISGSYTGFTAITMTSPLTLTAHTLSSSTAAGTLLSRSTAGADSGFVGMAAASAFDTTRSAFIAVYGVDAASQAGNIRLNPGTGGFVRINDVNVGPFATGTDAANLTGTVASARIAGAYTGFTAITVTSTDASNNVNPVLTLYRNSATPAAGDLLGQLVFSGNNDALAAVSYAEILAQEVTITAGAHVGKLYLRTANAGAIGNAVVIGAGMIVGAPTGGEKGIGSLNAQSLYANGLPVTSGVYTPALTNATNVAASTAFSCQWMQVGSVVTVSGRVDIDITTLSTATDLLMTLPVASALANSNELAGTGLSTGANNYSIRGDPTTDKASFQSQALSPSDTTSVAIFFSFTYRVL